MTVQKSTNTVDKVGISNTVSNDRAAHPPPIFYQTLRAITSVQRELSPTKDSTPCVAHGNDTSKDEYVVERIFRHIGEGDNLRYVVRWYGYGPDVDTVESVHHIQQHFTTSYWRRVNKENKQQHYITEKNYCTIQCDEEKRGNKTI